jgi:hypothetical protein
MIRAIVALIVILLGVIFGAHLFAAPPANPDPRLKSWFESLKVPGTSKSCCDMSDCRRVAYRAVAERDPEDGRIGGGHYEVLVTDEVFGPGKISKPTWVPVPEDRIITGQGNPTGSAVACWTPYQGVICFVRPAET